MVEENHSNTTQHPSGTNLATSHSGQGKASKSSSCKMRPTAAGYSNQGRDCFNTPTYLIVPSPPRSRQTLKRLGSCFVIACTLSSMLLRIITVCSAHRQSTSLLGPCQSTSLPDLPKLVSILCVAPITYALGSGWSLAPTVARAGIMPELDKYITRYAQHSDHLIRSASDFW